MNSTSDIRILREFYSIDHDFAMKSNPPDTQIKEKDVPAMVNYGMDGKVALVTGASGGIGRASAALPFAACRCRGAGQRRQCRRRGVRPLTLIAGAGGNGPKFQSLRCQRFRSGYGHGCRRDRTEFGRLDYAFNNAGINNLGARMNTTTTVWARSSGRGQPLTGVMLLHARGERGRWLKSGRRGDRQYLVDQRTGRQSRRSPATPPPSTAWSA